MIAYFILVHRYPEQFKRLFKAVYNPKNQYLVHVDKKAGKELKVQVTDFLASFPNAHILKSQNVLWGGYSMVNVELKAIKELLKISKKWDAYINLSGQDFPLRTQAEITEFLKANPGKSFLKVLDQVKKRPITMNRIDNYYQETPAGFVGRPYPRTYMPEVTPYVGGQWKILSREACEFICQSPLVAKFRKFYKNTLIADESFFQTVLMNTQFPGKIVNDDKRAIIWIPDISQKLLAKKILVQYH